MNTYCISLLVVPVVEEMATETLCYCVLGLSYVLFTAGFAGNAVDEVGTVVTDVVFSSMLSAIGGA